MKKILIKAVAASAMLAPFALALPAHAETISVTFEPTDYSVASINGQDGWIKTGSFDANVVANTSAPESFGTQSLQISDAVTSGSFGDQTFSRPLLNEAGETDAVSGGMSGGVRQNHFEAQFDIMPIEPGSGATLSISPDRGDGARMSYLRFEDQSDGVHVFFFDVQGENEGFQAADFVESPVGTITSDAPHTVKITMDFVDGPSNDLVKVYIDGALVQTGTSWENYYRFDTESQGNPHDPTLENKSRTVDSLLFREAGTAHDTNIGKGFLIDNLTLSSSTPPPASCPVGTTQSVDPIETVTVNSALSANTSGPNVLSSGSQYLLVSSGTWTNSLNVADTEYASIDGWVTHMNGYDITPFFLGEGEFDLQINDAFVNWGSYDGANHTYSYLYTGTGAPVNLRVFDGDSNTGVPNAGWYGDNSGSLTVDVYSCVSNEPPPPSTGEQCKKNGWKTLTDTNGKHFKNQGDCVSFFATEGKNTAAGN